MSETDVAQKLREEEDDYCNTVLALKALAHELLWDDKNKKQLNNGEAWFGRKMETSPNNPLSPNNSVTPDLVIQYSSNRGTIAEAKIALPTDVDKKKKRILEIIKYDDDLVGWNTKSAKIKEHDLILLAQFFRAKEVAQIIEESIDKGELDFNVQFALLSFGIVLQAKTFIALELLYGTLLDKVKEKKLSSRLAIDMGHIVGNPDFASIELYDARPPTPYLMFLIHTTIFQSLSETEHDEKIYAGRVAKSFSIDDIRSLVAANCAPSNSGPRTPMIPKKAWILDALSAFVKLRWAKRIRRGSEDFEFEIKNRRDPKRQFIEVCARMTEKKHLKASKAEESKQLPLPHMGDDSAT